MLKVALRQESKSHWERRTPLNPKAVGQLIDQGFALQVQESGHRVYGNDDYRNMGAALVPDCQHADIVLGIKEPKFDEIWPNQVHLAFSHTIKGQDYNMGLLKHFMDSGCTLIDYEVIKNSNGQREIAFGRFAGLAGAMDTLWLAAQKWHMKFKSSPLDVLQQTYQYQSLGDIQKRLKSLAPLKVPTLRIALAGSGNVGRGAKEILDWLGITQLPLEELSSKKVGPFYCVFETVDLFERLHDGGFDAQEYKEYGKTLYRSTFDRYLKYFDVLIQTPFWDHKYPKQLDRERMLKHRDELPWMIGDISCDIDGSLECTKKACTIENPVFTYNPDSDQVEDGLAWFGPSVMSIDNLPCELPRDASDHFSDILVNMVPEIARMNLNQPLLRSGLSTMLQNAVIVYNGELTPNYRYLKQYL